MDALNAEAHKMLQAQQQLDSGQDGGGSHPAGGGSHPAAVAAQVASKEFVRTSIAVDMIDIAKQLSKSSPGRLQSLAAAQGENEQMKPEQALAVPTGKPLSIFDPPSLPAAYTEFLFGDCVPFLKRETPVTCQQIFSYLPNKEKLEYHLESDAEPYVASDRSRYDTPEFYAVFASFLRTLKLLQSTKAFFERQGFNQDIRTIAAVTADDFVKAALRPTQPRTNQDLICHAGNEKVVAALRNLGFSTATVPMTDGHKMRLHHLGCAMNMVFGPLTVFHTHNYADNYSPEILRLHSSRTPSGSVGSHHAAQTIEMPTLQEMHRKTAASPRTTAKFCLLMEELSYRHLYRVQRARIAS
jgi:hypothetical protein